MPFYFNFQPTKGKNGCSLGLQLPKQYKDVHTNPDSDCYLLRVTTLNFIFTSVVMGMTLTLVSDEIIHLMCYDCIFLTFELQRDAIYL